jgi:acetylornithine deacetylase
VTDPRDAVDAALARLLPGLADLLAELVAIPSVGGSPAESDLQHLLGERLDGLGLEVDRWPLDLAALANEPGFPGSEVARTEGWGVVARLPGTGGGRSLLLNAHTDVVPVGDRGAWTSPPFTPTLRGSGDERRLVGRGACDMKGGLAAALLAAAALSAAARSGARLAGDVLLAPVIGEEDGGLGTYGLLRRGWRADGCVIPEPTALDLVAANAGALTFRLTVRGRSTHASRRTEGVSVLDHFPTVLGALRALEERRNASVDPLLASWPLAYPLSVGRVSAGDWASSVPDLLVAEGRYGVALGEPVDQARAAFEDAVATSCAGDPWLAAHPVQVEWWGGQFASGRTDPQHPLLAALAAAHRDAGGAAPVTLGAPYGSDLRLLTGIGDIPTVQYGPGDAAEAHAPDESVALADVAHCARALAWLAVDWCGARP